MPPHTATPRSPAAASLLEVEQAGRPGGLHPLPARLTARSTTQHSSAILCKYTALTQHDFLVTFLSGSAVSQ